jgi:hypothetical protein
MINTVVEASVGTMIYHLAETDSLVSEKHEERGRVTMPFHLRSLGRERYMPDI